ncbi:unnamed protein product [Cutaneotrichosporon oleaginosum]
MLSRDKRPQPPRPFANACVHPAFLPVRVHVSAAAPNPSPAPAPAPAPSPSPPWRDASKVSPAWEGWGRGPATVAKSRM